MLSEQTSALAVGCMGFRKHWQGLCCPSQGGNSMAGEGWGDLLFWSSTEGV